MTSLEDIRIARSKITPYIYKTPLIFSDSLSSITGAKIYIKAENLQKTGSFKVRGAFNKLLFSEADRVIAASMGNHAQAVAYAATVLGKRSKIVMPVTAPIIKEAATRGYGAEVCLHGEHFKVSLNYALSQKNYLFIHPFDDEMILAGQGTIALEIIEDLETIDYIVVPVGGGGLISGIAIAIKAISPGTGVIGVQSEAAPSAYLSFKEGKIIFKEPQPTIADGIAIGQVGEKTFEIIRKNVDDILLIDEETMIKAIIFLIERKKLVVEGAGAVALAAVLKYSHMFKGKKVVIVVSGGNIDLTVIDKIVHKGLVSNERIAVFGVELDDVPGALHKISGIIASRRINIINILHDRLSEDLPFRKTRVIFTVEIRNRKHFQELLQDLKESGYSLFKSSIASHMLS